MERALCYGCVEDSYLSEIIRHSGQVVECSVCGDSEREAVTLQELGKIVEPIMREHFKPGPQVKKFGKDDKDWWEQEGDPMSDLVQEVLGQYFDFEDEIVDAIIEADDYWPPDGGEPYWDTTTMYVPTGVQTSHYLGEWHSTLAELKHSRRFFSPQARSLFVRLFGGINELHAIAGRRQRPVARSLPAGTSIFRARVCDSRAMLKNICANPAKELGPPPVECARAGRMNAEGVVVLYAAEDAETCLAEMRPALGSEIVIAEMKTTHALRVLDFSLLEKAWTARPLSYFQPDFTEEVERHEFLRRLHTLISQPVVPGREDDYLITQTMAEYLAHVHDAPFDGILFSSVQRAGGMNIVLFPKREIFEGGSAEAFPIKFVESVPQLISTTSIRYSHRELRVTFDILGELLVY